jgi:hypothetical protein
VALSLAAHTADFVQRHACRWAAKWHKRYKNKQDSQRGIPKRIHRLCQGVLYSRNVIGLWRTRVNVILFMSIRKVTLPVYVVTSLKHARQHDAHTPCLKHQRHRAINVDRPGQAPRATGCWGFPDLHRIDTWRWWGCQPFASAFTPQEISLVLISVSGWVDPRATVRPAGLHRWKIPMTRSGIETATLRLVAQCLN